MAKGARLIKGQEYLLNGRYGDREAAMRAARELRRSYLKVRIIKRSDWDFMMYTHGAK